MICFFMLFVVFRLLDYGNRPCLCQTVRTSSARRDGVVLCDTDVGRDPQADVEVAVGNIHFDGERAVERTCRVVGEFRYVASLHVIDGLDRLLLDGEGLRLRAVGLMHVRPSAEYSSRKNAATEPDPPKQPFALRTVPEATYLTGMVISQ